jgi:hypothetical protein
MALQRGIDGSDPVRAEPVTRLAGAEEIRRLTRSTVLASGTLACPHCDAPVAPAHGGMSPGELLGCPYCEHTAAAREFLTLGAPTRPARVDVRVSLRRRPSPPS